MKHLQYRHHVQAESRLVPGAWTRERVFLFGGGAAVSSTKKLGGCADARSSFFGPLLFGPKPAELQMYIICFFPSHQ